MFLSLKLIFLTLTVIISACSQAETTKIVDSNVSQLKEEHMQGKYRRYPESYRFLEVNYKGLKQSEIIGTGKNFGTSIVYSKAIMCGSRIYPTVIARAIKSDTSESYDYWDLLFIFNEELKRVAHYSESTVISNTYTDSSEQFTVGSQPKFTLENIETFVCSSQVNICGEGETLINQCTFEDGRQANMCQGKGRLPHTLRVGRSATELETAYNIPTLYTLHQYRSVNEDQPVGLSGIADSLSFSDGDTEYAFENHWSTRSRDDYDFHAEFNIRKNGEVIESQRCLETNYE